MCPFFFFFSFSRENVQKNSLDIKKIWEKVDERSSDKEKIKKETGPYNTASNRQLTFWSLDTLIRKKAKNSIYFKELLFPEHYFPKLISAHTFLFRSLTERFCVSENGKIHHHYYCSLKMHASLPLQTKP